MDPHRKLGVRLCNRDRLRKMVQVDEHCRGGENTLLERLEDAAIDSRREPEVVGVDDEALHRATRPGGS